MTEATRPDELQQARREVAAARAAWQSALKPKVRREAAERLEYWSNRAAFLANARPLPANR